MSDDDLKGRNVVPQGGKPPSVVTLGPLTNLDLSFLPDAERSALMKDYARGVLDVAKKAHELHVDVGVLKSTLDQLATTTREVSESGNAVTITHTQTTKIGRTEVKMGNTEEAKSGKLSSSQTGEKDWTPYYIFAAIAAVVLIGFLFAGRH
jgi:hypothetical protein